jgi:hypothetical protein
MKQYFKISIILCVFLNIFYSNGQQINALRSLDDNEALAVDTTDWKIHRVIKDIKLKKDNLNPSVSFGGEIKEQMRSYKNMSFGDVKPGARDHDIYLQERYMIHADLRLNKNLRFFGQLHSNHIWGKDNISPEVDHDNLGVMQAFIDLNFNIHNPIVFRLGRQDLSFGSERMIGTRDGPSIRQTFDGARITVGLQKATGDFLVAQPVSYRFGVFDNKRNKSVLIYASYWTIPVANHSLIDFYYIGNSLKNLMFAGDTATETRHSVGLRFSNSVSPLYYDAEVIYQFGNFGTNTIMAWQISSIIGYRWNELSLKPRIQFKEGVISGDKQSGDGIINNFRPISARPPVNDLLPAGPSNIVVISPEAEITVFKGMTFALRYLAVWRLNRNDGMYSGDVKTMTRIADAPGLQLGKFIASGFVAQFAYVVNKHFTITAYGGHFFAGEYIINTGKGENNSSFSSILSYKF